jgi:hypothetical protein
MRKCAKYFPIYEEAVSHTYDFATAPFSISLYMRKTYFLFYQCIIFPLCSATLLATALKKKDDLSYGPLQFSLYPGQREGARKGDGDGDKEPEP